MQVPDFLKLENDSLLFNQDNKELQFYVPEKFFEANSKNAIAEVVGEYISMLGLCVWTIVDSNGKKTPFKTFCFPTMMLCKPTSVEKIKGFQIKPSIPADDFRILHFQKGDEVVSQTRVPQLIENVELFYKLAIITGKLPRTIDYNKIWEIFYENMDLSGNDYGLVAQLFGVITAELCRDPNDINKPFRLTDMKDMNAYNLVSIKLLPKYISPYTALISENFDEAIMSSVMLSDKADKDIPDSPLEKIVTM